MTMLPFSSSRPVLARAVFALPKLDSAFTSKTVLLVDRAGGEPLPPDVGPWRLVVPDEKRAARWVRQVTGRRVLAAPAPISRGAPPSP
jgi:hypothetical protein